MFRSLRVLGLLVLAALGPGADFSAAQQQPVRIETVFPAQMPRGQSTVLNVAFPGRDVVVQAAEVSPAAGVTVSGMKQAAESQGIAWWELTVNVAKDAAPGTRSLVLVMPMGRTTPITVTIPSHVPSISDLRIVAGQANQPTVEVQFAVADESRDLGDSPYVWFTTGCGGSAEPLVGAVTGKMSGGTIRAAVPNPRGPGGRSAPTDPCQIRLRTTDSGGIESNTLKGSVDFKD